LQQYLENSNQSRLARQSPRFGGFKSNRTPQLATIARMDGHLIRAIPGNCQMSQYPVSRLHPIICLFSRFRKATARYIGRLLAVLPFILSKITLKYARQGLSPHKKFTRPPGSAFQSARPKARFLGSFSLIVLFVGLASLSHCQNSSLGRRSTGSFARIPMGPFVISNVTSPRIARSFWSARSVASQCVHFGVFFAATVQLT
jgi:hypothetical protein